MLTQIGVRFAVIAVDIDETPRTGEAPLDYVRRVALEKARAGRAALPVAAAARPVLAADTAVVSAHGIFGKPGDQADAARMLRQLSGRTHRVLTAVALLARDRDTRDREWLAVSASRVTLRRLDADEIRRYWHTGEPADKAGGYAIQGYGALFVTALEGSYSGVMGLPLCETGRLLERAGIALLPAPTV